MSYWSQLTEQQRFDTLKTMREMGGGFAYRLAQAWQLADSTNSRRLAEAFPDLIKKFGPESIVYVGEREEV